MRPVYLPQDGGYRWRLGWMLGGVMAEVVAEGWAKTRFEAYEQVRAARRGVIGHKEEKLPPEEARQRKRRWAFGWLFGRRKDGEA